VRRCRRDTRFSALEVNGGVGGIVVSIVIVLDENVVIAVTNLKSGIFLCIVKLIKTVPVTFAHRGGNYRCAPRVSRTVCAL
jgi:hypothetical protein